VLLNTKQPKMIDDERHEDVGRDGQAREGPGSDLAHELEPGDDRESANNAAERRPSRHRPDTFDGWQRAREAEPQHTEKSNNRQEETRLASQGVVSEFFKTPFIGGPQAFRDPATR
jgi:hypothetical protein